MRKNKPIENQKEKEIAKSEKFVRMIKSKSSEKPQRIVIDEILHDDLYRILSAELKSETKKSKINDISSWGDEEEHLLNWKQLSELISKKKTSEIGEGQVFRIEKNLPVVISEQVKQQVRKKTKMLLDHEGKTLKELKERR